MKFAEAKEHLYEDGSLRDVYVLKTSDCELNAFLEYVRPMVSEGGFYMGGEVADLPATYFDVVMASQDVVSSLSVPVGGGHVNCYFFDCSELELDFRPSDYTDEDNWNTLSSFLQGLADAMEREVVVTAENIQDCVHLRFRPG